jgi:hypothetical protein
MKVRKEVVLVLKEEGEGRKLDRRIRQVSLGTGLLIYRKL